MEEQIRSLKQQVDTLMEDKAEQKEMLKVIMAQLQQLQQTQKSPEMEQPSSPANGRSATEIGNNSRPLNFNVKLEIPKFDGFDARTWIKKCEKYFELCKTPYNQKVDIASFHMIGKAEEWMSRYFLIGRFVYWSEFSMDVIEKFGDETCVDRILKSDIENDELKDKIGEKNDKYVYEFVGKVHDTVETKVSTTVAPEMFDENPKKTRVLKLEADEQVVMASAVLEDSQFDTCQVDYKMTELLGVNREEFFTSYNEVHDSFDTMGFQENLLIEKPSMILKYDSSHDWGGSSTKKKHVHVSKLNPQLTSSPASPIEGILSLQRAALFRCHKEQWELGTRLFSTQFATTGNTQPILLSTDTIFYESFDEDLNGQYGSSEFSDVINSSTELETSPISCSIELLNWGRSSGTLGFVSTDSGLCSEYPSSRVSSHKIGDCINVATCDERQSPVVTFCDGLLVFKLSDEPWKGHVITFSKKPELHMINGNNLREKVEKFEFQAEVSRLIVILINSLHSNKDIFLRELISNASDALDKIRFLSLNDKEILGDDENAKLEIQIKLDKEKRIPSIHDKGIGMTKEDLIKNLGTIAKSGISVFVEKIQTSGDLNLIGQLGVEFYSVYLVADYVEVISKHNDVKQHVWESKANGDFGISVDERNELLRRGTEIRLHLREEAEKYLEESKLKKLVKKYSEFINFPIRFWATTEVDEEFPAYEDDSSDDEEKSENYLYQIEGDKLYVFDPGGIQRQMRDSLKAKEGLCLRMNTCMDQLPTTIVAVCHLQGVLSKKRHPFTRVVD